MRHKTAKNFVCLQNALKALFRSLEAVCQHPQVSVKVCTTSGTRIRKDEKYVENTKENMPKNNTKNAMLQQNGENMD